MSRPIRNAVTLTIDGREVTAPEGTMLVDAAKQGDIEIPVFCYEPKLGEPVGACRMCLVEIEGLPKLQTACSTPIRDGMVVYTRTQPVVEAQNAVVEFLLVNHPLDCPVCDKGGECPLQDIAMGWGPGRSRFSDPKRHFRKPLPLSPDVLIDRERCILCYRCTRFSQEVSEDEQLQMIERGDRTYVGTFDERPYVAPFHGNIIELCPVGALTSASYRFRARPWDIEDAGSVCTLCPSQCNVRFSVRDERVERVLARDNPEVDDGWLCDRGRFGFLDVVNSAERVTEPLVQDGGALRPASWEEALDRLAAGLRAAGPRSAAIAGGGASNEEGHLLQGILRRALGSPHVDCAAGPVDAGLLRELTRPELAARVPDLDYAGAILVVELDPVRDAPILDLRVRKAVRRGGAALAVASAEPTALDGRAVATARYAPGEAGAFLTSLETSEIWDVLKEADDVVILWGERLWRSPGAAAALLGVAEALGMADRVGAGMIEVPVAANGRGLREAGCLPGAGPGLSEALPGSNADGIRAALEAGGLEALLLFDADPVWNGAEGWRGALSAARFVASFSMSIVEDGAAALADVVIPLETHAEKDGTVTHPDGRVQRLRSAVPRPGRVRPGQEVLAELAAALGLAPEAL
jgi:NADH-quinone oxidoreductase subunit G